LEATGSAHQNEIGVKQPAGSRVAHDAKSGALIESRSTYLVALGFVLFFGALVRVWPLLTSSFPLNDGGMFMQAIIDLRHANFRLPDSLHYNGLPIAYAYPPLGFYIAGLVASATNASLFNVLRVIPALFSMLTLGAFMLLARDILRTRDSVVIASLAFALVPRSHSWEIMGGGLTRSIGFFFAILAIWQAYRLYTERSRTSLILTSVFAALACLSHLEMAMFVAFSAALLFLVYGRSRSGLRDSILVAVGVLALTSPWWGTVLARHGAEPFLNAGQTGNHSLLSIFVLLLNPNWGQEPFFPLFSALAFLGLFYALLQRRYFLPLWIAAGLLIDPRKFETEAMVPMSMLVAICVVDLIVPLLRQRVARPAQFRVSGRIMAWVSPLLVGILILYGTISSVVTTAQGDAGLAPSERQAMQWVNVSTAPDSRFIVISGDLWPLDRSGEWLPALSDRVSVSTVQGYEWLPDDAYAKQIEAYRALQECTTMAASCVEQWGQEYDKSFDYVYIATRDASLGGVYPRDACCGGLAASFASDPNYSLVFQNDGATIFERKPAAFSVPDQRRTPL
jgi:hypothetical protein